ncbi:hypothetical protein [Phycicoccus sp. Soil748]|uniref:hypothetical protein n=1 Tax=Phycicoccus sp. Soil748 TaxID=1736397 RepID=UPI000702D08C|nr:hypothetical protein [Phycicoccus sp. Soil748]KRE54709.1 hypothetical protein ASG70_11220 [Phycicoccus sp. Soil748]
MNSSARARTFTRLLPLTLAAAAVGAVGVAAGGGSAQASPVLAANLRLMDHARMGASNGPVLHSMVAPSPPGFDATKPVSDAALTSRAGIGLDRFGTPVATSDPLASADVTRGTSRPAGADNPASGDPVLGTSAATVPAGTPHMTNLLSQHVEPSCTGTGSDGKRVQVVYAYEAGSADDFAGKEAVIRNEIANIDDVFAVSSAETGGGRRVRWAADTECVPQIAVVQVPAGAIRNSTNGSSDWSVLKSSLASQGLNRADRKYLVFGDAPAANPGICGIGDRYLDESPTNNDNDDYAAQYGAVYQGCFAAFPNDQTSAGHELVHTLGAVQGGAPNASQYGHCTDDGDLMCYPDGSSTPMRQVCPTAHEPLLDCNHDDYFSTSPVAGTYLADHWNVASSSYLDTVPAMSPPPTGGTSAAATSWTSVTATGTTSVTLSSVMRDSVSAQPVTGALVTVQRAPYGSASYSAAGTAVTDASGKVSYTASASTAATYRFAFSGNDIHAASTSGPVIVKVPTRTALVVKSGYPTTFSGSLANAVTGKALPTGTPVTLKVKWYGTSTWASVTTLRTDAYGKVAWSWNAYRNGYFQLVHAGGPSTVSSASAAPLVRIPTKVTMAVRSGRPDALSGRLTTGAGASMKYVYVSLQYRAYGTSTWRTGTQVRTSSTGTVSYSVQPRKRMYYRWVYAGTSTGYLGATSAQGYVSY